MLVGDPHRATIIKDLFTGPVFKRASTRGFLWYTGLFNGVSFIFVYEILKANSFTFIKDTNYCYVNWNGIYFAKLSLLLLLNNKFIIS